MTYSSVDSFYVSDAAISSSPSRKDGVDESTEAMLRRFGCDFIQEAGILLRLPQAVMATGQVLMHRFYCKQSLAKFDVRQMAPASLWLASKIEEGGRRVRDVLNVFHRIRCRRDNLGNAVLSTARYEELKKELLAMELLMLRELGFVCHVEHPHKFVLSYLLSLNATPEFLQEAWSLANDSLRTTLCVQFKSEVVACGVVYAAARRCKVALPQSPPWWKVFDAEEQQLVVVCQVLAHLYRQPKSQHVDVSQKSKPLSVSVQTGTAVGVAVDASVSRASGDTAKVVATAAAAPVRLRLSGDVARVSSSGTDGVAEGATPDSRAGSRKRKEREEVLKLATGQELGAGGENSDQRSTDGRSRFEGDGVRLSTCETVDSAAVMVDGGCRGSVSMEREKSGKDEERQGRILSSGQSSNESVEQNRWDKIKNAKDCQGRDERKRSRVREGRRLGATVRDDKYDESRFGRGRDYGWETESDNRRESKSLRTKSSELSRVESCRVSHLRTNRELTHAHHGITSFRRQNR